LFDPSCTGCCIEGIDCWKFLGNLAWAFLVLFIVQFRF
jgi:hypothetical protein